MRPTDALAYRRILLDIARDRLRREATYATDGGYSDSYETCVAIENAATRGEVFYVSADMTAVATAAAKTMPEQVLQPGDLPSANGFIVFDRPVGFWSFADGDVPVEGFLWVDAGEQEIWETSDGPTATGPDGEGAVIQDGPGLPWRPTEGGPPRPEDQPARHAGSIAIYPLGRFAPSPSYLLPVSGSELGIRWTFTLSPVNDENGLADTLLATWTLMQQSLSVAARSSVDRAERRRSMRAQLGSDVVVIRLRRRSLDEPREDTDEEGVPWSHRWLVSGHWRNQWLPSRACHRLQWITGYVKGPQYKPLVIKDRVTAWVR